jgi:hypothetical protein
MGRILTAEEFLTLVLAKLRLKAPNDVVLRMDSIDRKFEDAYDWLRSRESEFDVTTNFTFRRDPMYGNTAKFRDAWLAMRERGMIQPVPSKHAYRITLSEGLAQAYMQRGVLAEKFLDELVDQTFRADVAAPAPF